MHKKRYLVVILLAAIAFVIPELLNHQLVIGADAVFHYNRFYEAAMQLKNHTFSGFISIYGFQQSGRIVNALYGPVFAYFQGILVLISGSWFHYQILSSVLLLGIAGYSMYGLLRYAKVAPSIATIFALLFMTTYGVQYWLINQGFTAWGTSLLPLALIPMVDLIKARHFSIVKIALSMAVLTQIHLLSALMLGLIYALFFGYYLFRQPSKAVFWSLAKTIGLYAFLTLNIWVSLASVYLTNHLQMPFTNQKMSFDAINQHGQYWLRYPRLLVPIILITLVSFILQLKKVPELAKLSVSVAGVFLVLATSLIPWTTLVKHQVPLVTLIQFPFRFFAPFTVLFFLAAGLLFNSMNSSTVKSVFIFGLAMLALISVGQQIQVLTTKESHWEQQTFTKSHSYTTPSAKEVRKAFFNPNPAVLLNELNKATPDYLPLIKRDHLNKYNQYEKEILQNQHFNKKVVNGKLELQWTAKTAGEVKLPVVMYKESHLSQAGEELTPLALSDIGTPTIKQHIGVNQVTLTYQTKPYVIIGMLLSLISWVVLALQLVNFRTIPVVYREVSYEEQKSRFRKPRK